MSLIEIRPPTSLEEYDQACAVLDHVYYERGITAERAMRRHPKAIFVAVRDGEVLGSVGFRSGEQSPLPVEHYFGFDVAETCSFARDEVFEIVKLASRERGDHSVFRGLVAACAQYAFVERSFRRGFAIVKPTLAQALNHFLHVPTYALPYPLVQERAAADYPRYFFEGEPPQAVAFWCEDYEAYLDSMFADLEGKAVVQCADFDHRNDYSRRTSYPCFAAAELAA